MKIHTLPGDPGATQKRRRIGRGHGSGWGKTAGRGHNGAQSRSGYKRKVGYEGGQMPLHRRIPKRGFHNLFRTEYATVNVTQLERFEAGTVINFELLYQQRLVRKKRELVKILGDGELTKALTVEADAFSATARQKIEAAGGTCSQREKPKEQDEKSGSE